MRALFLVGVGLACATATLSAQRSDQIELGVYGSFTRFDRAYQLPNRVGGGLRFGYFLSDRVSIEVDGTYLGPSSIAGRASYFLHTGHASLVFNFPMGSSSFYVLGGASRVDLGTTAPYDFAENGVHGGAGLRVLIGDRLGLRVDGKAFYRPPKSALTGLWTGHVIGSAGISYVTGRPRRGGYYARSGDRNHQWYWGGQGGLFIYKTNVQSSTAEPIFGGHWLITSRRTALYVGIEQSFFLSDAQAVILDNSSSGCSLGAGVPCRDVTFSAVRRILFGLVAHPAQRRMEPFVGGGFAMVQVLSPFVDCQGCSNSEQFEAEDLVAEASSKAFFWLKGGLQINYSSKLNVFANYLITSSSRGFLLDGNTHTLQGGVRLSLGTSKEGITERN